MSNSNVETLLENRLPDRYELERNRSQLVSAYEDISSIERTFKEHVRNEAYSRQNPASPLEVSMTVDVDGLGEHLESLDDRLADIHSSNEEVAEGIGEVNANLEDIEYEIMESNRHLDNIDNGMIEANVTLDSMDGNLSTLLRYQRASFGLDVITSGMSLEFQRRSMGIQSDIAEGIENIVEGVDELVEGQEVMVDQLNWMLEGQDAMVQGLTNLTKTMVSGFQLTYQAQVQTAMQVARASQGMQQTISRLNESQQERHLDLVQKMQKIASSEYSRRAQEKWEFAYAQYKAKNHSLALTELDGALRNQSTHLPSLVLFAQIATENGRWAAAKNTYEVARKIAKDEEDKTAFQAAVIGLAKVEQLVGNPQKAESLLRMNSTAFNKGGIKSPLPKIKAAYVSACYARRKKNPTSLRRFLNSRLRGFYRRGEVSELKEVLSQGPLSQFTTFSNYRVNLTLFHKSPGPFGKVYGGYHSINHTYWHKLDGMGYSPRQLGRIKRAWEDHGNLVAVVMGDVISTKLSTREGEKRDDLWYDFNAMGSLFKIKDDIIGLNRIIHSKDDLADANEVVRRMRELGGVARSVLSSAHPNYKYIRHKGYSTEGMYTRFGFRREEI